jgi:hypothetical protein
MENIIIQKEHFDAFLSDFERLLSDFEEMVEASVQAEASNRLSQMKSGEVEMAGEEDYQKYMKKKGISE